MSGPEATGGAGPDIFIVAGESSGDALGARLMDALRAAAPGVSFRGVGGEAMIARGLQSLFPMADIAVMGFVPVLRNLRRLLRRIGETADAVVARPPDVLVIIDSPDFTHRVARRVRARRPNIPIVDYVSPTVWAWRPGRAKAMRAYIDHVLALLPFEPQAHRELGGPACTYVGHPLIERLEELRGDGRERSTSDGPLLVVLPGSRRSEVERLMPCFGAAVALLKDGLPSLRTVIPAVGHLRGLIETLAAAWPHAPGIVSGEEAKLAAFRSARAALAASGTVTLELALAQTPTVLAYKVSRLEEAIARRLVRVAYIGLPNIIAGRAVVPELIQDAATPDALAAALHPLITDGEVRAAQLAGFAEVDAALRLPEGKTPSAMAAEVVLGLIPPPARSGPH